MLLLLYDSARYSRERLAGTMSGSLYSFSATFERQISAAEKYILNLEQTNAKLRGLSERGSRTEAWLDLCDIAQGFPALLSANDILMGIIIASDVHGIHIGQYGTVYGDAAGQLEQKMAVEGWMTRLGASLWIQTDGWYLETVGGRLYFMRSVVTNKTVLTAAVDLRPVFEELLHDYGLEGQLLLAGPDGSVLAGEAEPELIGSIRWQDGGYGLVEREGAEQMVVCQDMGAMQTYYLLPYEPRAVAMSGYGILLVTASVFVVMAIPFLLFYMWQEILGPMSRLVETMDRISSGDLSARPEQDYRNAEFTRVNETFNHMIDQITRLKIDRYEKELAARRSEMAALKLQSRPHFVLICLKSVYGMVQTGSREDAQKLILLLSRYLRYILSFTLDNTSLENEIEQCRNYVELSRIGRPDPIELSCAIDPELAEMPLPQISLLTLVENSIKHGRVIGRPLRISITARILHTDGEGIVNLSVSDNGRGFSDEELRELNRALPHEDNGRHVGLHNVIRRLQLLYGEEAAVAFTCRGGACVELFIPLGDASPGAKEEMK